jgi:hypothetical protein
MTPRSGGLVCRLSARGSMARSDTLRAWRNKNGERIAAYRKEYVATHPEYREKNRARARRWTANNRERVRDAARARAFRADPEKAALSRRMAVLKTRYGITVDEYDQMLIAQGGGCAICGRPRSGKKNLPVDHNHKTGRVRGVLCHPCNRWIGVIVDDPEKARRAAAYLESAT